MILLLSKEKVIYVTKRPIGSRKKINKNMFHVSLKRHIPDWLSLGYHRHAVIKKIYA